MYWWSRIYKHDGTLTYVTYKGREYNRGIGYTGLIGFKTTDNEQQIKWRNIRVSSQSNRFPMLYVDFFRSSEPQYVVQEITIDGTTYFYSTGSGGDRSQIIGERAEVDYNYSGKINSMGYVGIYDTSKNEDPNATTEEMIRDLIALATDAWNPLDWEEVSISKVVKDIESKVDEKYTKPSSGIPKSDLATGVVPTTMHFYDLTFSNPVSSKVVSNAFGVTFNIDDFEIGSWDRNAQQEQFMRLKYPLNEEQYMFVFDFSSNSDARDLVQYMDIQKVGSNSIETIERVYQNVQEPITVDFGKVHKSEGDKFVLTCCVTPNCFDNTNTARVDLEKFKEVLNCFYFATRRTFNDIYNKVSRINDIVNKVDLDVKDEEVLKNAENLIAGLYDKEWNKIITFEEYNTLSRNLIGASSILPDFSDIAVVDSDMVTKLFEAYPRTANIVFNASTQSMQSLNIDANAFYENHNIRNIVIKCDMTENNVIIGGSAFEGCEELRNFVVVRSQDSMNMAMPEDIVRITINESSVFKNCINLKRVELFSERINSMSRYNMGNRMNTLPILNSCIEMNLLGASHAEMFNGCANLEHVPSFKYIDDVDMPSSIQEQSLDKMFYGCFKLERVDMFGVRSFGKMSHQGEGNEGFLYGVKEAYIQEYDDFSSFFSFDNMGGDYCGARAINCFRCSDVYIDSYGEIVGTYLNDGVITFSNLTSGLKVSEYAFKDSTVDKFIINADVIILENAFENCKEVVLYDNFDGRVGMDAFLNCENLIYHGSPKSGMPWGAKRFNGLLV